MKINFADRMAEKSTFGVRIETDTPDEVKEQILNDFKKTTSKLDEYINRNTEITDLVHKNKELLATIKAEFEFFSKNKYPEFDLWVYQKKK